MAPILITESSFATSEFCLSFSGDLCNFTWINVFPIANKTQCHSGPLPQYKNLVEQGKLQHDLYQERVASELENLLQRLEQYEKDMEEYHVILLIACFNTFAN